jgi:hypothetical protein
LSNQINNGDDENLNEEFGKTSDIPESLEGKEEYVKKGFWTKTKEVAAKIPFVLDTEPCITVQLIKKHPCGRRVLHLVH